MPDPYPVDPGALPGERKARGNLQTVARGKSRNSEESRGEKRPPAFPRAGS